MASGGLVLLRGNNAQIGWAKESTWGTGVLPTAWWQWRRGTSHREVVTDQAAREGDAGIWENLAWRQDIYGDVKIVEAVRPRTIGCALQALFGTSSDTYTAPTKSTTLANSPAAGATTLQSTADLGNVGTLAVNLTPGVASQTYEVVTLDLTTRSGPGPYTYTIASSGTLRFAHTSGDALTSASTHAFTAQATTYDPYTLTVYRGDGAATSPFQAVQYQGSVCYDFQLDSGPGGTVLMANHSWYSLKPKLIAWGSPSPVLEGFGQTGLTGAPFTHAMAGGTWSINNVTTGNALAIEKLTLQMKRATNPKEILTEGVNPDYFAPDEMQVSVQAALVFRTWTDYYNTYFGGVSTAGTTVSNLLGYGQFSATYTMDAVNSLALSLPYCRYVASEPPALDEKAGPVRQTITLQAMSSPSNTTPITMTLKNSQASAY